MQPMHKVYIFEQENKKMLNMTSNTMPVLYEFNILPSMNLKNQELNIKQGDLERIFC